MEQININIIPHTHWDKEWYFTSSRSLIYSLKDFDEIIEELETNSDFKCFHLDGQLSIIEEYLELHPNKLNQIINLVQKGKLIIGPWYTQPDTLVISGENLLKNLELGIDYAKKFGKYQSIGYLPDSFGMSSQMPQIYKNFNLSFAFFRRGIAKHLVNNREFLWKSPDGSKIFTHNLHHYGNMAYPPNETSEICEYFKNMVTLLQTSSNSNTVLLFNGEDQKPIRKNLPKLIEIGNKNTPFKIQMLDLETALKDLEKEYNNKNLLLPVYEGEFTFGQFSRTHKSIYSTRVDLKQLNNKLENYLSNIVEPMSVLATHFGLPNEQVLLDKIWKLMLLNSAHDSIGACNSDKTNEEIKYRYLKSNSLAKELVEYQMRELGIRVKQKNITQFQVYNLLPYVRSGEIEIDLISPFKEFEIKYAEDIDVDFELLDIENVTETYLKKSLKELGVNNDENSKWQYEVKNLYKCKVKLIAENIPAMGYQTLYLQKSDYLLESNIFEEKNNIENKRYKIEFDNNQLRLIDKENKKTFSNILTIIDDGDEGDSYDYSEPKSNSIVEAKFNKITVKETALSQKMILEGYLLLPKDLSDRVTQNDCIQQPVTLSLKLNKVVTEDGIFVQVKTINKVDEHRLRILINTEEKNDFSYADIQFGTIKRPTYLPEVEVWKKEKWDEKPRTIEPLQSFVANGFKSGNIQIVTECVREYQFVGEGYSSIAMTLYRSVPYLGKSDLQDRPGRESGTKVRTEGTRHINEEIVSDYVVRILTKSDDEHSCSKFAKEILTPFIGYQSAPYKNNTDEFVISVNENRNLELNYSLLEFNSPLVVSIIKNARNSKNILLRVFNPKLNESVFLDTKVDIQSKKLMFESIVNTLEESKNINSIFEIKQCQFKTISLKNE